MTTWSTAACVKETGWPPIVREAVRALPVRLLATAYDTLPDPVEADWLVIVSHGALLVTDHAHAPALTSSVPVAPAAALAIVAGVTVYAQGATNTAAPCCP